MYIYVKLYSPPSLPRPHVLARVKKDHRTSYQDYRHGRVPPRTCYEWADSAHYNLKGWAVQMKTYKRMNGDWWGFSFPDNWGENVWTTQLSDGRCRLYFNVTQSISREDGVMLDTSSLDRESHIYRRLTYKETSRVKGGGQFALLKVDCAAATAERFFFFFLSGLFGRSLADPLAAFFVLAGAAAAAAAAAGV